MFCPAIEATSPLSNKALTISFYLIFIIKFQAGHKTFAPDFFNKRIFFKSFELIKEINAYVLYMFAHGFLF